MDLITAIVTLASIVIPLVLERNTRARKGIADADKLLDYGMRAWHAVEAIAGASKWSGAKKALEAMARVESLWERKLTDKQRATLEALWKIASEAAKKPAPAAPAKKQTASEKRIAEMKALREGR
jgi:hypothetical protein